LHGRVLSYDRSGAHRVAAALLLDDRLALLGVAVTVFNGVLIDTPRVGALLFASVAGAGSHANLETDPT
jgi:hypothetical protein